MSNEVPLEIQHNIKEIVNLKCWYVNAGRGVGSSFSISLGNKIPRKMPLRNSFHTEEYRKYEGEVNLLIWCTWRLEHMGNPILSSDDDDEKIEKILGVLVGKEVITVDVFPPVWDLRILFSDDYRLNVFCDHLPGNPSFNGNWDLKIKNKILFAGPGKEWGVEFESS